MTSLHWEGIHWRLREPEDAWLGVWADGSHATDHSWESLELFPGPFSIPSKFSFLWGWSPCSFPSSSKCVAARVTFPVDPSLPLPSIPYPSLWWLMTISLLYNPCDIHLSALHNCPFRCMALDAFRCIAISWRHGFELRLCRELAKWPHVSPCVLSPWPSVFSPGKWFPRTLHTLESVFMRAEAVIPLGGVEVDVRFHLQWSPCHRGGSSAWFMSAVSPPFL